MPSGLEKRSELPDLDVAEWIETSFQVKDMYDTLIVMTSWPAQKDTAFTIGNARYHARVHLYSDGAKVLTNTSR